jgi:hypothetical protein
MVEGPHGQATFLDFAWVMQEYHGPDIRFVFYSPDTNQSTNFLIMLNGEAAHQYTASIDWQKTKTCIDLNSPSVVSNLTVCQATGNYADYGY